MNLRTARRAHAEATQVNITDLVISLKEHLGPKLLALTIGVDERTIARWAAGGNRASTTHERRLRCAYQIFELLKAVEASATIRAWFMGMNPQLDDLSPAEAIASDQLREALAAARAFHAGG